MGAWVRIGPKIVECSPVRPVAVEDPEARVTVPELAWRPILAIASAVAVLLFVTSFRYGYFGDELYFLSAGRHLSWGYADQPPLLPVLARIMDTLFPGSVVGLRLPSTLLCATGVVLAGQTCRELGGRRTAQVITAGVFAVSPFFLTGSGHTLATHSIDAFLWTLISWLVVRWVRLREDRLLLAAGLLTVLALQAKLLIPVFWLAVGIGAALVGPRELLRRPVLWASGALAVLTMIPWVWWQVQHGWPEREMAEVVSGETSFAGGQLTFLPIAAAWIAGPLGTVLFCYGLWRLLRAPQLRAYRFLGLATVGIIGVFLATNGRPLYVGGVLVVCWAAGAVGLQERAPMLTERARGRLRGWVRWPRWALIAPVFGIAAALTLFYGLPVGLPLVGVSAYAGQPYSPINMNLEEFGWPQFADSVERAAATLPPDVRHRTVVVTDTYWQASAVEQFGQGRGLPAVYSPSRGFWYFGSPPENATTVLFTSATADYLHQYFADVRQVGTVDNGQNINNANQGAPIWLCSGLRQPWSQAWPRMRHMTFG